MRLGLSLVSPVSHALDVTVTKMASTLYNQIVRRVANAQCNDVAQNTRLFAGQRFVSDEHEIDLTQNIGGGRLGFDMCGPGPCRGDPQ